MFNSKPGRVKRYRILSFLSLEIGQCLRCLRICSANNNPARSVLFAVKRVGRNRLYIASGFKRSALKKSRNLLRRTAPVPSYCRSQNSKILVCLAIPTYTGFPVIWMRKVIGPNGPGMLA